MELREWLFRKKMKITDFSKMIDYDRVYLTNISNGKMMPGKHLARRIIEATDGEVTMQDLALVRPSQNSLSPN